MITKRGKLPATPHTEYYAVPSVLSLEEIHGTYGFGGVYSRKNHLQSYPTIQVKPPQKSNISLMLLPAGDDILQPYHILTGDIPYEGDYLSSRKPLLYGSSTVVSVSKPKSSMDENVFFRNGEKHELLYIQDGEGFLKAEYGNINFKKGLYLIIPKGTTYQIHLNSKDAFFLIMESLYPISFPPHYMNTGGQATLMSPVVETEIDVPELQDPIDKEGEFTIHVKHNNSNVTALTLGHHPFDVVGWEGGLYPFGFHIDNHHGVSREIHTAPPMRQTFQSGDCMTHGFALCSFKSQMEGWHPKDIPAPYAHSNVDSDEMLFFSSSSYSARKGIIQEASLTFHPSAIPHSPHGEAAKNSMNERGKISNMLGVMLDTFFESLTVTEYGYKYRDKEYALSWYKAAQTTGR